MKDKKSITVTNTFQKVLHESCRKPNKIWVEKGSEFYNRSMNSWLKDNDIEMSSTHNEVKSVVVERFIRTLNSKIYKYMTSISQNMYIDKLDDIVNQYNCIYHSTIKINPVDLKSRTYIDFCIENNEKDPKFQVGDHVTISKYNNFLQYVTLQICLKKFLLLKKLKALFRGHM